MKNGGSVEVHSPRNKTTWVQVSDLQGKKKLICDKAQVMTENNIAKVMTRPSHSLATTKT